MCGGSRSSSRPRSRGRDHLADGRQPGPAVPPSEPVDVADDTGGAGPDAPVAAVNVPMSRPIPILRRVIQTRFHVLVRRLRSPFRVGTWSPPAAVIACAVRRRVCIASASRPAPSAPTSRQRRHRRNPVRPALHPHLSQHRTRLAREHPHRMRRIASTIRSGHCAEAPGSGWSCLWTSTTSRSSMRFRNRMWRAQTGSFCGASTE